MRSALSRHRFVSLTGGEPLLQPEAVRATARALRARGPRILLETHGARARALDRVVDAIDVVSMDWKLASEVRRAGYPRGGAARRVPRRTPRVPARRARAPEVYVKVVVTPATRDDELDAMAREVAAVDPGVTLVVQPVTPRGPVRRRPPAASCSPGRPGSSARCGTCA